MARPVETSDDDLLDAAGTVLTAVGPAGFTLARAADAAGVSAATLVKRFGSKERLFLRLSQRWVASLDEELEAAARTWPTPLMRLTAAALHTYHALDRPATAHNQLAALAVDLQNDELRGWRHVGWAHVRRHLARHAGDAIAAGELRGCPEPEQLARIVAGAMEGGCLAWSVHPEGSLVARLHDDLSALLSGWTAGAGDE
jgi:AcrR family transcriptional regulator